MGCWPKQESSGASETRGQEQGVHGKAGGGRKLGRGLLTGDKVRTELEAHSNGSQLTALSCVFNLLNEAVRDIFHNP